MSDITMSCTIENLFQMWSHTSLVSGPKSLDVKYHKDIIKLLDIYYKMTVIL